MSYIYIFCTILFTVTGQLLAKWRMAKYAGQIPEIFIQKILFLFKLLLDPFILTTYICAFLASLFWLLAVSKLPLSHAYPFMSLSFILVFFLSVFIFGESLNVYKIIGILLIALGLFSISRGAA